MTPAERVCGALLRAVDGGKGVASRTESGKQ